MWRYPRAGLPYPPVPVPVPLPLRLPSPAWFPISWHRAGPLGPVVPVRMILAPTPPDPSLRLADALAATEPVDHVLGHGLVETLPVLLGNEDSGKHGGM